MNTIGNLGDEYSNNNLSSIGKKPINADYSAMTEKLRQILKVPNLKLVTDSKLLSTRIFFSKHYTENWSNEIWAIDFVLKIRRWSHKVKGLNEETIVGSFSEKQLLLSKL